MVYDFVVRHLSPDAFGHKHEMESEKKTVLSGTWMRRGFDLHFTVIALLKCSMREGLYPWRSLYNEF